MKKYILCFLAMGLLLVNCKKDDGAVEPGPQPDPDPNAEVNIEVQDYMWKSLNLWYFWQGQVPNLSDGRFSTNEEYSTFLASEGDDPEKFLTEKLLFSEDRFTAYSDDYKTFLQASQGISKSNGLEFGLVAFQDSDDIFGYVRYVNLNSDAATKDIARGDFFTSVNGTTLTRTNFRDLLFGEADTYVLNMADIAGGVITPNGKEVELTKQENFQKDPILKDTILDVQGTKVGYLMYTGFRDAFDEDLNAVFGDFVAGGVTELVLDLRYNGGGRVSSAAKLASMIYGTNTSNLFLRERWNDKIQAALGPERTENFFRSTTGETPINTLNLSKVYVLALNSSASASELVLNCLAPYMDVVHIGETTRGKNEFSIALVDDDENDGNYAYNPTREANINPNNSWVIQALVGRSENADGFSDYTAGLVPDIELAESLESLGVLGDVSEPLLARALAEITSTTGKFDFTPKMPFETFNDSEMLSPVKDRAIVDAPMGIKFE